MFDVAALTGNPQFGGVEGAVSGEFTRNGRIMEGSAEAIVDSFTFNGYTYTDFNAHATLDDEIIRGNAKIDNEAIAFNFTGAWSFAPKHKLLEVDGVVERFVPSAMNLWGRYPGASISGVVDVALEGERFSNIPGYVRLSNVRFSPSDADALELRALSLVADSARVTLRSDYADGELSGAYSFPVITSTVRDILSHSLPAVMGENLHRNRGNDGMFNDFTFRLTLKNTEPLADFFHLPMSVIYPVEITGRLATSRMTLRWRWMLRICVKGTSWLRIAGCRLLSMARRGP